MRDDNRRDFDPRRGLPSVGFELRDLRRRIRAIEEHLQINGNDRRERAENPRREHHDQDQRR